MATGAAGPAGSAEGGASAGDRPPRDSLTAPALWRTWVPYLLVAPSVVYLAVFFASPMVQAFALAFTDADGSPGLASIEDMLADPRFWSAVGTTLLLLVLILPLQLALALAMALVVTSRLRASGLWLYVYLLPLGISELGAGIVWYSIFIEQGWLNSVLQGLGLLDKPYIWLDYQQPLQVIGAIVVAESWRSTSLIVIIMVAGLQAIPKDYLEAADVFHAGPWQRIRHVLLPLLRPTLRTALILRTVFAFEVFATVIALAGTGTTVLAIQANRTYTEFQNPHVASAYGLVILLLSLASVAVILLALPVRRGREE
jgi:multiple sugar transport system permease protein